MPLRVIDTYIRYQGKLIIHNTVGQGIGKGFVRLCGIPQGCPLSMLFIALMMRPWLVAMVALEALPAILADDILVMFTGMDTTAVTGDISERFAHALNITHVYLIDMGAAIAEGKSLNFASDPAIAEWLRATFWKHVGGAIEVVGHFRYL